MDGEKLFCVNHEGQSAKSWCTDCEQLLCIICVSNHSKKYTKEQHAIITTEEYIFIPKYALRTNNNCPIHNQQIDFFCNDHNDVCCSVCASQEHKLCCDVISLAAHVDSKGTSILELKQEINLLLGKLIEIKGLVEESCDSVKKIEQEISKIIRETKQKIVKHLDSLERTLINDMAKKKDDIVGKNEQTLETLNLKNHELNETNNDVLKLEKISGKMQIFFGSRKLKNTICVCNKYIDSLVNFRLFFEESHCCKDMPNTMNALGEIRITEEPFEIHENHSNGLEDICLDRQTYIKIKCEHGAVITGCAVLRHMLIFSDFQNSMLIVHDINGAFNKTIPLLGQPSDIAVANDDEIAVTIWSASCISIINPSIGRATKRIETEGKCYGISCNDGTFWLPMEKSNVIQVFNLDGKFIQRLTIPTSGFSYAIKNGDTIVSSSDTDNNITCCSIQGTKLWSVNFETPQEPHQLAVDSDGNIFFTCFVSNNVVVVSSKGTQKRVVLGPEDGMKKPSAIYLSKDQLLVCNSYTKEAHLYKIKNDSKRRQNNS